jgi:L-histidine Nalpha-methyltransferase / hercynylcysteine S-oxide synthase
MMSGTQQQIIDVHSQANDKSGDLRKNVITGLGKPTNQKTLPTLLLYNEVGLRLYDDITTTAPEYYLFGAEEQILKDKGDEIVRVMHSRSGGVAEDEVVLELGAG